MDDGKIPENGTKAENGTKTENGKTPGSWKTPEVREAEARLEEAVAGAERQLAEVEQVEAELAGGTGDRGLGREQVEQIERLVREGKAPREVAELQRLIDAGELSWDDIAAHRNLDHEAVQRAFATSVPTMTRVKELADEGHDLPTILGADPNGFDPGGYDRGGYDRGWDDRGWDDRGWDDDPPDSFMDSGKW